MWHFTYVGQVSNTAKSPISFLGPRVSFTSSVCCWHGKTNAKWAFNRNLGNKTQSSSPIYIYTHTHTYIYIQSRIAVTVPPMQQVPRMGDTWRSLIGHRLLKHSVWMWAALGLPHLSGCEGNLCQASQQIRVELLDKCHKQWSGRFLGITGWYPRVCKSNRLHVHIVRFSFIEMGYILQIPLKWSVNFLQSLTSTGYFTNSTGSFVTNCRFSPIIGHKPQMSELTTLNQWSGGFLGIITGWDPSVWKPNRLHVDILRVTRYTLHVFLYWIGVYSINSSKMTGNFPAVSNTNRLFLKLNRFICNQPPVLPGHRSRPILWHKISPDTAPICPQSHWP